MENPEGIIAPDNPSRRKLERLMEILRLDDFSVHCALEREGWGERLMSPEKAVVLDNDQVSKADHIVTYPQNSPGAFMELGFAAAGADINMTNKSLLIILSGSVTQTDAINLTDEQNSVRGVIEWMKTQGSRAEVIYDNTVSLEEFVATVVPQIQDFVNPAQGEH